MIDSKIKCPFGFSLDEERIVHINSIPKTNIVFKEAKTNKTDVESILNILGVALPSDEFYR